MASSCRQRQLEGLVQALAPSNTINSHATNSHISPAPSPSSLAVNQSSTQSTPPPPTDELRSTQFIKAQTSSKFDLQTYPSIDLIRLLASLITEVATANDNSGCHSPPMQPSRSSLTRDPIWRHLFTASRTFLSTAAVLLSFHGRNIPTISLESYLLRIHRYCPAPNEAFLSLLVYFDRMSKLAQEAVGSQFAIDSYNVHRLVIAGMTVASKTFSDRFYTNSRYAKVGGLPLEELNQLELQFLLLNDFKLMINPEEMQRYADQLFLFSEARAKAKSSDTIALLDCQVAAYSDCDTGMSRKKDTAESAATIIAISFSSDNNNEKERGPSSSVVQ